MSKLQGIMLSVVVSKDKAFPSLLYKNSVCAEEISATDPVYNYLQNRSHTRHETSLKKSYKYKIGTYVLYKEVVKFFCKYIFIIAIYMRI